MSEAISRVTDDFITRLRGVRDCGGDRAVVDQLTSYAYRWSLEGESILRVSVAVPFRPYAPQTFLANELPVYAVVRPSVCLSVVMLVHRTQLVEIFDNVFTPYYTLAIR